ncbi:MAG: hypothetical protein IJ173_05100 [Kiritimatiellae bacterium]|nr:hypothetical protein [Kiritimatiellia bacterium]
MKRSVVIALSLLSMCAAAKTNEIFTSAIESPYVYGLDGAKYEVLDGEVVEARPLLRMALPDGAAISADGITPTVNYTNINGVAHTRVMIDFSCNFDWRGWHPFIQHVTYGGTRSRLELQEDSVYLGGDARSGVSSYRYAWHGYVVGYAPPSQSGYYSVSVEPEPYDGEDAGDGYYIVTPSGENAPARVQYVTIDQRGNISPSGAVATIAQAAATETRLAAAEVAAVAYTNAEAQTEAAVDDLAAAIIGQSLVVYEDDFMYSLGDAIAISTNCHCRIYDFKAKVSQVTVDGVLCDRSWVYFGFTENIGSLNPVAQFKDSLSSDLDWGEITCGTPEVQDHSFVVNGEPFDYCYRMSVDIPHTLASAFLRVYTEITSQVGDGSVLNIVGGIAGGMTGTVTWGANTLEFVGGLAVEPEVSP